MPPVPVHVGTRYHDSGAGHGRAVPEYEVDPGWELPRNGVRRGWVMRGTVPKIKDVYADQTGGGQSLSF